VKHSSINLWKYVSAFVAISFAAYFLAFDVAWPRFFPDEMCHLGWSRVLSNTGGFYSMGLAGYCEPGYALLIAPLRWIFGEQESFYRAAILLNAALVGSCFLLARYIGQRRLELSPPQAWTAGVLAAYYPGVLAYAGFALPETLLYTLTLAWLLAWTTWIDRRSGRTLAWLVLATCALFLAHSRMLVFLLAISVGALSILVRSRKVQERKQALYVLVAMALTVYLSHAVKGFAIALGWDADPLIALDRVAATTTIETMSSVLSKAAGQLLFALFATAGLALVPLAWLTRHSTPAGLYRLATRPTGMELKSIAAPILLVLLVMETAVFLSAGDRFDLSFYGRYAGPLIVVSMLTGLALLNQGNLRHIGIGFVAFLALCLLLVGLAPPEVPYTDYSRGHVAGALLVIDWLASSYSNPELWQRLTLAILAISTLTLVLVFRPWWYLAGAALATAVASLATGPFHRAWPMSDYVPAPVATALSGTPCIIYWSDAISGRLQIHQIYRLQYLYPTCQVRHFISSNCDIPRGGVLIAPFDSDCPGSEYPRTPLPPDLALISLGGKTGE
jgi:hypothetical protein